MIRIVGLIALAVLAAILPAHAQETFPTRMIRIVIPFSPGGPNDIIGRPIADKMSETLGQPIVIENRPGAAGRTATLAVARSTPDGYTVLMTTNSHVGNQVLYASLPYDVIKDFQPVTMLAENYGLAMAVRPGLAARTARELIAEAKRQPGRFTFAHAGVGNATHVAGVLLEKHAGIELLAVPYKGSGTFIADVIADQVDICFISTAVVMPNVQSGLVRVLATTGPRRVPTLPDVPTMMEIGYPEYDWRSYYGFYLPAGTPRDRLDKLRHAALAALGQPQVRRILHDSGLAPVGSTPEAFLAHIEKDLEHQRKVMALVGIQPQQ